MRTPVKKHVLWLLINGALLEIVDRPMCLKYRPSLSLCPKIKTNKKTERLRIKRLDGKKRDE